jgi:caffeoyl-CoA O-methyltransferase
MLLADPAVERYAEDHSTPLPVALGAIVEETALELGSSGMMSGPVVARLLDILVHAMRAQLVVEFGTFSGVSAIAMAGGLAPGGRLITCEIDRTRAAFARQRIEQLGLADRIEVRVGPALEAIADLAGPIDLVFIDADKQGYLDYYEAALPKLAAHGLIVADNTLRHGQIIDPARSDPGTRAIAAFNDRVRADDRVVATLLTVRDGITIIRRAS